MTKGKEAGRIQVYVRVRPFTEREKERREPNAIEIHNEHSLIRVLDKWRESNYFYDGVFGPEAKNEEVYNQVGKPLVHAALNGYKGTLLTYGQTGTGKTYTLLSDGGVTTRLVSHCFDRIRQDEIHNYRVTCSFLQVYQEKVYDLLNTRFVVDLPVREHPKRGVYVANLSVHEVRNQEEVFALLEIGKKQLVIAETKMVRHSSRSHSIIQLIVERRLKADIVIDKSTSEAEDGHSTETVQESIMAVDETISNLLKELKHDRKSHHKGDRECLKELMDKKLNEDAALEDFIVKGKINLCDLAGSERLTKTKAEGVRLTEAKYLNTSLLELGNVIHALARGNKGHVPYRNSTLTRLLQDCLGDNGKTNFIVCIAPSLSEVNETKCSLNFGLRAMRITNVARLSVEVDYKVLAERLARRLDDQDRRHKFEKLEYLREIQRLKSEVTLFRDTEHYGDRDTDKLVTVIANLSKSVQREKEQKKCLQSELVCIKRQISHPVSGSNHDVEALLLSEVLSMQLLASLNPDDGNGPYTTETLHTQRAKDYMNYRKTQETFLTNAEGLIKLMESLLQTPETSNGKPPEENSKPQEAFDESNGRKGNDYFRFNFSQAGAVELFSKDCSIKISPRSGGYDPCTGPVQTGESDNDSWQGVKRMIGKLVNGSASLPQGVDPNEVETKQQQPKSSNISEDTERTASKISILIKHLASSKRKIERQICNLLAVVFDEQLSKDGELPQWQEIGKKLNDLILFRRNNAMSPTDLLESEDDSSSVIEKCLHYVMMDKALLSCLLVLELAQIRQKISQQCLCMRANNPRSPEEFSTENKQNENKGITGERSSRGHNQQSSKNTSSLHKGSKRPQSLSCKSQSSSSQNAIKAPGITTIREGLEAAVSSPEGEMAGKSPSELASDLVQYRQSKRKLKSELREINEDTCKLETEVFAFMEEKTRLEEELIFLKDTVYRLKSELFHLKLEKSNLENDLMKSKNVNISDREPDQQVVAETAECILTTELSDVLEVSHESVDSENSSQMSEENEQREIFLKNCLASMSHVYTLVPSPEDDTLTDDDITETEGQSQDGGSVTDTEICDSDEDIIITRLARAAQEAQQNSSAKPKRIKSTTSTKCHLKSFTTKAHIIAEEGENKDFNITITDPEILQRELKKALIEINDLYTTCNSMEEELMKAAVQISESNQKIEDLQIELKEEKTSCQEIRKLYMNVKDTNDVLENKVATLRDELERAFQENDTVLKVHSSQPVKESDNLSNETGTPRTKSSSQTSVKSRTRSPARNQGSSSLQNKTSVGRTSPRKKSIDLLTPPQQQEVPSRQLRLIHISEENAELKTKLDKLVQEKQLMEKKWAGNEELLDRLQKSLSNADDNLKKATKELLEETKQRVEAQKESAEKNNVISNLVRELQAHINKGKPTDSPKIVQDEMLKVKQELHKTTEELEWKKDQVTKLQKEIATSHYLNEDLESNNANLESQVAKLGNDILKWKNELDSVVSECQVFEAELALSRKQQFDNRKEMEILRNDNERLCEENSFLKELKKKLEIDYQQRKERTKVAEGETLLLQRANSELRSKLDSMQEYNEQLRNENVKARDEDEKKQPPMQKTSNKELEQTQDPVQLPEQNREKISEVNSENKKRTGIPKPTERRKNRERSPSTRVVRYSESKIPSKVKASSDCVPTKQIEESKDQKLDKEQKASKNKNDKTPTSYEILAETTKQSLDNDLVFDSQTASLQRQLLDLEKSLSIHKMDLDKAQAKIESLNTELEIAHGERKDLEQRLIAKEKLPDEIDIDSYREMEERYETISTEYNALLDENSKLQLRILNADNERDGIRDGCSQIEKENELLKQQLVAVDSNRIQLEMTLQDLELKSKEFEERSLDLEKQNKNLNELVIKLQNKDPLPTKENVGKVMQETTTGEQNKRKKIERELADAKDKITKLESALKQQNLERERKLTLLTHCENERDALKVQISENIEKTASIEIQLMELRCSNDGLTREIDNSKEQQRQSSYKLQEVTVSRDMMEKRLTEALINSQTLQTELKERQEKISQLIDKVRSLESQINQSPNVSTNGTQSNFRLHKQISEDANESNLESLLLASKTEVKELSENITSLEQALSQAEESVSLKEKEIEELEKKTVSYVGENEKVKRQLEDSNQRLSRLAEKSAILEEKFANATNEAEKKKNQLETIEIRLEEELKRTQELQREKQDHEKQLKESQNKIDAMKSKVKQTEGAFGLEKARNEQLEGSQQQLVINYKKQQEEINEERREKDELKKSLKDKRNEISKLHEKMNAQLNEIDCLKRQNKEGLKENHSLRNDLENSEKRMRNMEEMKTKLQMKDEQLCSKKSEIENLHKQLDAGLQSNEALRTQTIDLEEQLLQAGNQTSSFKQTITKLQNELQAAKEIERKSRENFHELQRNIEKMEVELKSAKTKNEELHKLLDKSNLSNQGKNKIKKRPGKLNDKRNRQHNKKIEENVSTFNKNEKAAKMNNTEDKSKLQLTNNVKYDHSESELPLKLNNMKDDKAVRKVKEQPCAAYSINILENDCVNSNEDECKDVSTEATSPAKNEDVIFFESLQNVFSSSSENNSSETVLEETEDIDQQQPKKISTDSESMEIRIRKMAMEALFLENKTACLMRNCSQLEQTLALTDNKNKELAKQLADSKKEIIELTNLSENIKRKDSNCKTTEYRDSNLVIHAHAQTNTYDQKLEEDKSAATKVNSKTNIDQETQTQTSLSLSSNDQPKNLVSLECSEKSSSYTQTEYQELDKSKVKSFNHANRFEDTSTALKQTDKMSEEIVILREERNSLVEELMNIRAKEKQLETDLVETRKASLKVQEDYSLLSASYKQEKEALFDEIEMNKNEIKNMKKKWAELNESRAFVEDLQQKNRQAEKIISELEKELVEKSNVKNEVERELWECQKKVKEMLDIESRVKVLSRENEEMSAVINRKENNSVIENKDLITQTAATRKNNIATEIPQETNTNISAQEQRVKKSADDTTFEETANQSEKASTYENQNLACPKRKAEATMHKETEGTLNKTTTGAEDILSRMLSEDSQLHQNVTFALKDINQARQENKKLKSEKASLEIQLSDAVEEKNRMESEFLQVKLEAEEKIRVELGVEISDLRERYSKLETVLSCVLEENARVESEIANLREENTIMRDYKITEVSDSCTQITPRSTEDEEEDEENPDQKKEKRNKYFKLSGTDEDLFNSTDSTEDASVLSDELHVSKLKRQDAVTSSCTSLDNINVSTGRPSAEDSQLSSPRQSENLSIALCIDSSQLGSVSELESPSSSFETTSSSEGNTDSNSCKNTFDSINRLNSEIAELKCQNTILENDLSITKGQNSDLHSQVQKQVSRNHNLKQKVCDRSIAIKKLERELQKVQNDNKQLQNQTSEIREELNKVEKDKTRLERNLAASKAEVKKTKTDLSYTRAECYNTMKAYTNLQIQNKKLQARLDKVKAELRKRKEIAQHDCETASERSWSSGASVSLTDLSFDNSPASELPRSDFPAFSEISISPSSEASLTHENEFSNLRSDLMNQKLARSEKPAAATQDQSVTNIKKSITDTSFKAHSDDEGSTGNESMLNLARNQIRDDQSLTFKKKPSFTLIGVTDLTKRRAKSDTNFSGQAKKISSPRQGKVFRSAASSADLNTGPNWGFSFDSDYSVSSQGGSSIQGSPSDEAVSTMGEQSPNSDQILSPDSTSGEVSQSVTKAKNKKIKTILKKFNVGRKTR